MAAFFSFLDFTLPGSGPVWFLLGLISTDLFRGLGLSCRKSQAAGAPKDSLCLLGLFDTGHRGACSRETFQRRKIT
jgi:hypothetical protein